MMRAILSDGRSLGSLFGDLRDGVARLFRQEAQLLKAEMREAAQRAARDSALLAGGLFVAALAAMAVVAALSVAMAVVLSLIMTPLIAWWLGPLIVAIVLGVIALAMVQAGRQRLRQTERFAPTATRETMKENKQWIQGKIR